MRFTDIIIEDTSDVCRLTIPYVQPYHYGIDYHLTSHTQRK